MKEEETQWQTANFQDFWAEIAPREHVVQIYETDKIFFDTLEGYVASGLMAGEAVIVICSADHLRELNLRLIAQKFDLARLKDDHLFTALTVTEMLDKFMVKGWPDEKLFFEAISSVYKRSSKNGRRIRAFGEMVAYLWEQGNYAATVHLEHLWNKFCTSQELSLYCAYPKSGFTRNEAESIEQICCTHAKVISGNNAVSTEIHYTLPRPGHSAQKHRQQEDSLPGAGSRIQL